MSERVRVYQLANELGLTNKELIDLLAEEGIEVKSHASTVEAEFAELVREHVLAERRVKEASIAAAAKSVKQPAAETAPEPAVRKDVSDKEIHLKPPVVVRDLAEALGRKPNELIGELMTMNIFAAITQVIEDDVVAQICERHGFKFVSERRERGKAKERKQAVKDAEEAEVNDDDLESRPPVVAFLGHVDHGKTSLLDAIRKTDVVSGEAGGITQHIGASTINWQGHPITLLDTPGHEAFTAMRARGANATDIVVLVVAADDGIMPQTEEALSHAQAAEVPIIIAMNKMDLPGANPDKVFLELQQHGITSEQWGGQTAVIPVSAITGEGIDNLIEHILLEAEMAELKANPDAPGKALVIEAQLEGAMGATANILIRDGSLEIGDAIICGAHAGRIKALIDTKGNRLDYAGPSTPVKILGLSGVPEVGEKLLVCASEKEARRLAEERAVEKRDGNLIVERHANLDDLFRQIQEESRRELKLIVKTDVKGSCEAIADSLAKLPSAKIKVRLVHNAPGEISESDILLAATSDSIVVGFHVRIMPAVQRLAKNKGVEVRMYSIIYELLEDIVDAMRGKLEPEQRETGLGTAEIIEIFEISKTGKICGCRVNTGVIRVGAHARVTRDNEIIYLGHILNLKRFKDDVKEVRNGLECGIRLDNFEDFEVGDKVQVFEIEKIAPEL